jgi:hypothetical protein
VSTNDWYNSVPSKAEYARRCIGARQETTDRGMLAMGTLEVNPQILGMV